MQRFKRFDDIFWKYMLAYKKRTVFTILGITLSVILFFGAGTLYTSIYHALNVASRAEYGDFEAYGTVNPEEYQRLKNLDYIDEVLLISEEYQSFVQVEEGVSMHLTLRYFETFEQSIYQYKLLGGRYPENDHELLLGQYQADYFGVREGDNLSISTWSYWYDGKLIGDWEKAYRFVEEHQEQDEAGKLTEDSITIDDLEQRTETEDFQVVGIYENTDSSTYDFNLYNMSILSLLNREKNYKYLDVCVRFRNHKNHLRDLKNDAGIYLDENEMVTRYESGYSRSEMDSLLQYILFVSAFAILFWIAVVIIRNVFTMTMAERSRDYGILRCMGISKYRLRGILRKEGFVMAAIGCVLGMGITILMIEFGKYFGGFRLLLKLLRIQNVFHVHISIWMILGSIAFIFCAVLFSLLEPARQIGTIAPVDAIIGKATVKKERFKRRNGTLVRWIFGIEGEYAYKNLLRNKGKFVASVIGITISVTGLIISFDLMNIMHSVFRSENPGRIFDARAYFTYEDRMTNADIEQFEEDLLTLNSVESVHPLFGAYMSGNEEYFGVPISRNQEEPCYMHYYANGFNEEEVEELKEYLLEGELDYSALQEGGVVVCRYNKDYRYSDGEWLETKMQMTELQVGDTIRIPYQDEYVYIDENTIDETKLITCPVVAVLECNPYQRDPGWINVVFAREYYQGNVISSQYHSANGLDYIGVFCSEDYDVEEIYEFQILHKSYGFSDGGVHEEQEFIKGCQQLILIVAVMIIGIGALNIWNTLSSNIALRKWEFQIMSAVGMSRKQILKMLSLEGGLSAVFGSFIGILLGGFVGYWLTMFGREVSPSVKYLIPWAGIILAIVLTLGITGFSLIIARKDLKTWDE